MKQLKNIGDVLDLIEANRNSSNPELAAHAETLLGPRTRGSTTKLGLESLNRDKPISEVSHESVEAPCVAYRFHDRSLGGEMGAVSLCRALVASEGVVVRQGEHGPELVAVEPRVQLLQLRYEGYVWVVVGECEGEQAVFTWHPGEPLKPYSPDGPLTARTGVKLV